LSTLLTDEDIAKLIAERKQLPASYTSKLGLREKRGHKERELDITGDNGSTFRLILRQSSLNILDFSAILAYLPEGSTQTFRLRRCNGKSHEHTNKLEKQTFYDFHIHYATERYQTSGLREDAYAVPTDKYADFHGALRCLLDDCSFDEPVDPNLLLF
jgi:hypothetical protein